MFKCFFVSHPFIQLGGREIALWLASPSVKQAVQVRAWYDVFVSERWNATNMLLTCPTSAANRFNKGRAMCSVYVIIHVKDPKLSLVQIGHRVH